MKSTKVSRILIPVDFSPASQVAIEHGTYLANLYRADLLFFHMIESANAYPKNWFGEKNPNKELIQKKVTEQLSEYGENITKKYGVYVQQIVTTGRSALKITEAVEEHNIDLIVMGAHGVSGFEELFIGSIARKVVNLSSCPVITVRGDSNTSSSIKSIVLPIDESKYSRQKVSNILPLAVKCKSVVHILGLVKSDDKAEMAKLNIKLASVEEAVEKAGLTFVRKVVLGSNIAMEALKYSEQVNAELLAIMTDHESSMTGMFMGAFARQIVNHSKVPVMSIKPETTGTYESAA